MTGRFASVFAGALLAELAFGTLPTGAHGPSATVGFHSAAYTPATVRVYPGACGVSPRV